MKHLIIAAGMLAVASTAALAQTVSSTAVLIKRVGAPGPVVAAGLPGLVFGVGYSIYWLRNRRRRRD
jgi:hypothetical protein